jgi:hypothetical protein
MWYRTSFTLQLFGLVIHWIPIRYKTTKTGEKKLVLCTEKEREFLGASHQNLFAS